MKSIVFWLQSNFVKQVKKTKGIILEPEGRNTAPAFALAALQFINKGEDPILLVLSADHLIENIEAFHQSITIASNLAENNKLITCGDKTYNLEKNQSAYIPKGEIHRLENQCQVALEIIEVQTGDYLGEDDIIRLEDDYQRD